MTTLTHAGFVNGSGTTNFDALHDYTPPAEGTTLDSLGKMLNGEFVIVERDDDLFVGRATVTDGLVTIHTGTQGRPAIITLDDVDSYKIVHAETFGKAVVVDDLTPVYNVA